MAYEKGGHGINEKSVQGALAVAFAIGIAVFFLATFQGALPQGIANAIIGNILSGANTAVVGNISTVFTVVVLVVIIVLLGFAWRAYRRSTLA